MWDSTICGNIIMRREVKMKKWITCILCAIIAFLGVFYNAFETVDKMVGDTLYHHPGYVNGEIRIIKIDDQSMNRLGDFSQWERSTYAKLLETLYVSEEVRPAVVGFDILFSSDKIKESDDYFAEVCAKYDNIVCGFSYVFEEELSVDAKGELVADVLTVQEKVVPYEALQKATKQGFVNALMDNEDSVIRSAFLYYDEDDGTRRDSFDLAIYKKYMEFCGLEPQLPTEDKIMTFRYSGKPTDYENISLVDVLDGKVPAETFDDCIVLVGAYAAGMMDSYYVPVDRGQQMYGVEVHANALQAIMEDKMIKAVPEWLDGMIAAVVVAMVILICEKLSAGKTLLFCLAVAAAKIGIGFGIFNAGWSWNNLVVPVMVMVIGIYYTILHYYKARKSKQNVERAFQKYVAPQIIKDIAKDGNYELKLGGETRQIAALFVDIRGFTPLSESLSPEQVVEILNEYLELTTNCIFRHGGTLDKFIGDAAMAVFNMPFDTEDYVYKAVLAAWDIVQGGKQMEERLKEKFGKSVSFGVGINCGPAVVGNIGCEFRMDYTAIGDTVNTAARLESNAPRGKIYISSAVYEQVKERITVEEVGTIPLKGKSNEVFVYSVTGVKE